MRTDRVGATTPVEGALAAAKKFEPAAVEPEYPLYRDDLVGNDGLIVRGHLSYTLYIYGNAEGRGDAALYVPAGFTRHSIKPASSEAVVTFYYPRLGNLNRVTLAVFHVANFCLVNEGNRVRIGDLGGPGGSNGGYKHSVVEFYRGNTGLPRAAARQRLRIDPVEVFVTEEL